MNAKKKTISREEAAELYKDLQKAMKSMKHRQPGAREGKPKYPPGLAASIAAAIMGRESPAKSTPRSSPAPKTRVTPTMIDEESIEEAVRTTPDYLPERSSLDRGHKAALTLVIVFTLVKIGLNVMEGMGFAAVKDAEASMASAPKVIVSAANNQSFSKEEVHLLTSLDSRRAELEERNHRLDERESDLARKDKELVVKLSQLRELTDRLKSERDKDDKKRNGQLEQLANVYGSMAPNEAATLLDQLDVSIALSLIERMPEKRIGQILALMNPERALTITKMLSGRAQDH